MDTKQDSTSILELRNLSKLFGGLKAVDDVNMKIGKGELHCLIGPNGAGKSTIFRLITGDCAPTSGQIYFKGRNITRRKTWQRAHDGISIKTQIPGVYNELTLRDNIRIALQRHFGNRAIDAEIDRLTDFVGIHKLGNPLVKNMSHGQQQWLEIAMVLATRPSLLLLDEPAAGMGPDETEFTATLVKEISSQGMTIVFIDHDMDFVKRIANQITVLHYGRVFAVGTFSEIERNNDVVEIYLGNV
jgi:branched-chain amino acid transport system ATP-binding protein